MATYAPASMFVSFFVDTNGAPVSGGTLSAYLAGTTTPTAMYSDSIGTSAGSVVTLNARGEPEASGNTIMIWLDVSKSYRFVLKDASGTSIWTVDNQVVGTSLGAIDYSALDDADTIADADRLLVIQSGLTKLSEVGDFDQKPADIRLGRARDGINIYTSLSNTATLFSTTTSGTQFGAEPFECIVGSGGSVAQAGAAFFAAGIANCNTSTGNGYSGISLVPVLIFDSVHNAFDFRVSAFLSDKPVAANAFNTNIGLVTNVSASAPTSGIFFRAKTDQPNWFSVTKNLGVETENDTGIALKSNTLTPFEAYEVFRVTYDSATGEANFYIGGVLCAGSPHTTNIPQVGAGANLFAAAIRKSAGANNRYLAVDSVSLEYSGMSVPALRELLM